MTNVSITRNQNALETNVIQRTTMVEGYIANPVGVPVGFLDCELISNKVQNIGPNSTSAQYPSAKAVFEAIEQGGGSFSQKQSDWTQADDTQVDFIKHKPNLATVAISGSYTDLTDKPSIPVQAQSISSGETGYATGDQVYQIVGDVESLLLALRGNV